MRKLIKAFILFPLNVYRLWRTVLVLNQNMARFDELSIKIAKLHADFSGTLEYYSKFTDSLKNITKLYADYEAESKFMRIQVDEILTLIKDKQSSTVDMKVKPLAVQMAPPVALQTFYENQGLSQAKKP